MKMTEEWRKTEHNVERKGIYMVSRFIRNSIQICNEIKILGSKLNGSEIPIEINFGSKLLGIQIVSYLKILLEIVKC